MRHKRSTNCGPVTDPNGARRPRHRRRQALSLAVATTAAASLVALSGVGTTTYDPATDPSSMSALTTAMGVNAWWDAGFTGAGVDVAVIDTALLDLLQDRGAAL